MTLHERLKDLKDKRNMLQKDIFSKSFEVVEGSSYSNPFHPTKLVPASYVYVKK